MSKLYPQLEGADNRLNDVRDFRRELTTEISKRNKLLSRNKRVRYGVARCSEAMGITSVGLTSASMGLFVTGFGIPAALPIAAVGLFAGVCDLGFQPALRRLEKKARRHTQLRALADTNLLTVSRMLSKGLADDALSDQEFQEMLNVKQAYHESKK